MSETKFEQIKELRKKTGASIMECKNALKESQGNIEQAINILRKKGEIQAAKKSSRSTSAGLIEAYIHGEGKIGVLIELDCETDFVARNQEFKELAHNLAMHIAAMDPQYISPNDIPSEVIESEKKIYLEQASNLNKPKEVINQIVENKIKNFTSEVCLLNQNFIKNPDISVEQLINEYINKLGENIKIKRFVRYQI